MIAKAKPNFNLIFLALVLFFIFLALVLANGQLILRRIQLSQRIKELTEEIANLSRKNEALKTGIDSQTKESYLEREAREKLQLKKPGETVVTIVLPSASPTPNPIPTQPWWQRLLEKLGF